MNETAVLTDPAVVAKVLRLTADGRPTECWPWLGSINQRHRYGRLSVRGRIYAAHRLSYVIRHGPIPEGLEPDHACRNRSCVNPDHLEIVTHAENVRRGLPYRIRVPLAICRNGHEYQAAGFKITSKGRRCSACNRDARRREHAKRRTT
jgi:hypothetical protein